MTRYNFFSSNCFNSSQKICTSSYRLDPARPTVVIKGKKTKQKNTYIDFATPKSGTLIWSQRVFFLLSSTEAKKPSRTSRLRDLLSPLCGSHSNEKQKRESLWNQGSGAPLFFIIIVQFFFLPDFTTALLLWQIRS